MYVRVATDATLLAHLPADRQLFANCLALLDREAGRIDAVLETAAGIDRVLAGRQSKSRPTGTGVNDAGPNRELVIRIGAHSHQRALSVQNGHPARQRPVLVLKISDPNLYRGLRQHFAQRPIAESNFSNAD